MGEGLTGKVLDSVEVVNDHKVVFHFSQPDPVSVLLFETGKLSAGAAISKAQWDKEGLDGYQERPTGTGSYRWVKRVAGSHTVSERVENHWRHTPDFKELVVQLTKEESTRMAALLAGETHIVLLSRDVQSQALDAGMKLAQTAFPSRISWLTLGGSYFLTPEKLDFEKSPWSNPDKGILLREGDEQGN